MHGKPRHPQTQGSVERSNAEVKKKLYHWMSASHSNKEKGWAYGLQFVQFALNSQHHSRLGGTPCKVVYGKDPLKGLASSSIPRAEYARIRTEEQLENYYSNAAVDIASDDQEVNPVDPVVNDQNEDFDAFDNFPDASQPTADAEVRQSSHVDGPMDGIPVASDTNGAVHSMRSPQSNMSIDEHPYYTINPVKHMRMNRSECVID